MSIAEYMLTDELVIDELKARQGDHAERGEPLHDPLELPQDELADADGLLGEQLAANGCGASASAISSRGSSRALCSGSPGSA